MQGTIRGAGPPRTLAPEERGSQAISEDRGLSQAQGLGAGTPEERDSGTQAPRKAVSIEGVELGRNGEATKPRWAGVSRAGGGGARF
ncbi:hypothetical protein FHR33_005114 [Nonomuraea dietziae]|uniref:Uncharacterized protein n=1 Tax=Nonomuraea dietziae TaxID=65515 RepID=A0A7W5V522_9ACTN|nr:hypothetical protein [Nonomuraea dietziae]